MSFFFGPRMFPSQRKAWSFGTYINLPNLGFQQVLKTTRPSECYFYSYLINAYMLVPLFTYLLSCNVSTLFTF